MAVHPGLQAQRWVSPEGRHDEAEEQRNADEDSGQDDLRASGSRLALKLLPHPGVPPLPTAVPVRRSPACCAGRGAAAW